MARQTLKLDFTPAEIRSELQKRGMVNVTPIEGFSESTEGVRMWGSSRCSECWSMISYRIKLPAYYEHPAVIICPKCRGVLKCLT